MKKFDILIQRGDTTHMNTIEYGENSGETAIGYKETDYNFAFGIVRNQYFVSPLPHEDHEGYLNLKVF